jgi:hypothetical protein
MQGKGKSPLPLHSIPKTNNNTKTKTNNKIKVVYTEDLTHPHQNRKRGTDATSLVVSLRPQGPFSQLMHGFALLIP